MTAQTAREFDAQLLRLAFALDVRRTRARELRALADVLEAEALQHEAAFLALERERELAEEQAP